MNNLPYEIICGAKGRFLICEPETGKVLDDAQGYGFTTKQKAEKAAWYKFKGGKANLNATKQEATRFWRNHRNFATTVRDLLETWFKEIAREEINFDNEISNLAKEMGLDSFRPNFLKYLP